jgi:hypothetical protein
VGDVNNPVALIIAFITSAVFGVVVKSIFDAWSLHRQGVSGREDKRKTDILAQRDYAFKRMEDAEADAAAERVRADAEARRRIIWREEAARLRLLLREAGIDPGPLLEDTQGG